MIALSLSLTLGALAALAEWLHGRRMRRVARLAFGPTGGPRSWTRVVPALRVAAVVALAWGLVSLAQMASRPHRSPLLPEGGYRHLVVALDVSPSMQLRDAGVGRSQTRAQRAAAVVLSLLERVAVDQMRISVVAFYNGARPVVVDTYDLEVVRNILNDLPLDYAFDHGKTKLFAGLREAATLAKPWKAGSTTLLVVSDGDTVPDAGMPEMPRSVARVIVVGVGDPNSGRFIDGHQSRQDAATLRQVATRLGGLYHNANEKQLASQDLAGLAEVVAMREATSKGRREAALAATVSGASVLALLPVALAFLGAAWQVPRRETRLRSLAVGTMASFGDRPEDAHSTRSSLTSIS